MNNNQYIFNQISYLKRFNFFSRLKQILTWNKKAHCLVEA